MKLLATLRMIVGNFTEPLPSGHSPP